MQHVIKRADVEAAGEQQQAEAWYQELSQESGGLQHSLTYRRLYLHWLQHPMTAAAAYLQRAIMNIRAKCYLQVKCWFCCLLVVVAQCC